MTASPFSMNVPPQKPLVLKPLRYCEFRVSFGDFGEKDVTSCEVFACAVVEEMAFCDVHGQLILSELAKEVGNDVSQRDS